MSTGRMKIGKSMASIEIFQVLGIICAYILGSLWREMLQLKDIMHLSLLILT